MIQMTLDQLSAYKTEEAIIRSVEGANDEWRAIALLSLWKLCKSRQHLTSDQVWEELKGSGHAVFERRVMGAIMIQGAKNGWLKPTETFLKSNDPKCHRRRKMVWLSLLCQ